MITRLPLDNEKLVAAILYIARHVGDPTKYKICKLIFLGDFVHVGRYGRPVVGGRHCAMPNGPVPSEALKLLNAILSDDIEPAFWSTGVDSAFHIRQTDKNPEFQPQVQPDTSVLSDSDLEVLDEVLRMWGEWDFGQLFELTHSLPAYERATEREPDSSNPAMDYEDFFEKNPYARPGSKDELIENYALSRAFPELAI
jgi:hypothetical protein